LAGQGALSLGVGLFLFESAKYVCFH